MRAFQQKTPSNYCGFHYLKYSFEITTKPYNREVVTWVQAFLGGWLDMDNDLA